MTVHELFRMAKALFPVCPPQQEQPPAEPAAPILSDAPMMPEPLPDMEFKPSHALYSSVTNRHNEVRQYRRTRENAAKRGGERQAEKKNPTQEET